MMRHIPPDPQIMLRAAVLARWQASSIEAIEETEEGWTILLKPGFRNSHANSHFFRAPTRAELLDQFRWWVMPCNCAVCKADRGAS